MAEQQHGIRRLAELAWPDVGAGARVLTVPLGATEQHGPHLPLSTDTTIAVELANRLALRQDDVVVAPALPYGSSGEHAGFPGTLSIGQEALELVVTELVRSADAFAGVVLISGHGGNAGPLKRAAHTLDKEGRSVLVWGPSQAAITKAVGQRADAHAGYVETSMLLALQAKGVAPDRAEAGNTAPLPELITRLTSEGVRAVSPNGVLGDPAGANAGAGAELLDAFTDDLVRAVDAWRPKRESKS